MPGMPWRAQPSIACLRSHCSRTVAQFNDSQRRSPASSRMSLADPALVLRQSRARSGRRCPWRACFSLAAQLSAPGRPHRLEVRTSPFQGENPGSIPGGDASNPPISAPSPAVVRRWSGEFALRPRLGYIISPMARKRKAGPRTKSGRLLRATSIPSRATKAPRKARPNVRRWSTVPTPRWPLGLGHPARRRATGAAAVPRRAELRPATCDHLRRAAAASAAS